MSINFNDVNDNLMKYFLLVDNSIKHSLYDTNFRYSIILILIFYCILLSIKNISKYIQIFDNLIFRLLLILLIIYFSTFDIQISILLVIHYIIIMIDV
jgi:quinol-cytochrome oxidoreductase complex cytochrome b subunit